MLIKFWFGEKPGETGRKFKNKPVQYLSALVLQISDKYGLKNICISPVYIRLTVGR